MRFLDTKKYHRQLCNSPAELPIAKSLPGSSYRKPDLFLQNSVRVFCRSFEENGRPSMKQKLVKASYTQFIQVLKDQQFTQVEFEVEYDRSSNNSSPDNVEVVLPTVSQTPEKNESNKRRRQYM